MRINRPWRVVAGAGSAALVVGLAASGVAASDDFGLRDRTDPVPVENVHLDQPLTGDVTASAGSADSPFDDDAGSPAGTAASAASAASASAASADSPAPAPKPAAPAEPKPAPADSVASAASASSASSADSGGSADSGDSADSAD